MTQINLSLYSDSKTAHRILDQLDDAGFASSQLELFEPDPSTPRRILYHRLNEATPHSISLEEADHILANHGLSDADIREYLRRLQTDGHLVIVQSGDEISGRAQAILNAYTTQKDDTETSYDHDSRPGADFSR